MEKKNSRPLPDNLKEGGLESFVTAIVIALSQASNPLTKRETIVTTIVLQTKRDSDLRFIRLCSLKRECTAHWILY